MRRIAATGWFPAATAYYLIVHHVGRRTTLPSTLLLPAAQFVGVNVVIRLLHFVSPRLRRQTADGRSALRDQGEEGRSLARTAGYLVVGTVAETIALARLDLPVALTLKGLLPPMVLLLGAWQGRPVPGPTAPASLAAVAGSLLLTLSIMSRSLAAGPAAISVLASASQAAAWCSTTAGPSDAFLAHEPSAFALLFDAAPIASALTGALAGINLLLHLPAHRHFFQPPHFAALVSAVAALGGITLVLGCLAMDSSAREADHTRVFSLSSRFLAPALAALLLSPHLVGVRRPDALVLYAFGLALAFNWCASAHDSREGAPRRWSRSSCSSSDSEPPASPSSVSILLEKAPPTGELHSSSWSSVWPAKRFFTTTEPDRQRANWRLALFYALPFALVGVVLGRAALPRPALAPPPPASPPAPLRVDPVGSAPQEADNAPPMTLDVVFSLFNEPTDSFARHVQHVRTQPALADLRTRVTVYYKGGEAGGARSLEELREMEGVDEVVELPNRGREGGTYLHHILRRFEGPADVHPEQNITTTDHADVTLFLQHHLEWDWIANLRFNFLERRTGFLSLSPYIESDCGRDLRTGEVFPRVRDIYSMFQEDLCPPTHQLTTWAAQMFVSRRRILANLPSKYRKLLDLLEAPPGHWVYEEGADFEWHGQMTTSNPFLGHAVERSWPLIFGCNDLDLVRRCKDNTYDSDVCQCLDL